MWGRSVLRAKTIHWWTYNSVEGTPSITLGVTSFVLELAGAETPEVFSGGRHHVLEELNFYASERLVSMIVSNTRSKGSATGGSMENRVSLSASLE